MTDHRRVLAAEFVLCPSCGGTGLQVEKGSIMNPSTERPPAGEDAVRRLRQMVAGVAADNDDDYDRDYDPFSVEAQMAEWDHDDEYGAEYGDPATWMNTNMVEKCDLCRGRRRILKAKAAAWLMENPG